MAVCRKTLAGNCNYSIAHLFKRDSPTAERLPCQPLRFRLFGVSSLVHAFEVQPAPMPSFLATSLFKPSMSMRPCARRGRRIAEQMVQPFGCPPPAILPSDLSLPAGPECSFLFAGRHRFDCACAFAVLSWQKGGQGLPAKTGGRRRFGMDLGNGLPLRTPRGHGPTSGRNRRRWRGHICRRPVSWCALPA